MNIDGIYISVEDINMLVAIIKSYNKHHSEPITIRDMAEKLLKDAIWRKHNALHSWEKHDVE